MLRNKLIVVLAITPLAVAVSLGTGVTPGVVGVLGKAQKGSARAEQVGVAHAAPLKARVHQSSRFSVTVTGRGPDVVLVPGLASSSKVWTVAADRLDKFYRVHRVQVAGFAGAEPGANAEGEVLGPLVEDLAAYAKGLERPALIGHSLGGVAALKLAAEHPDVVSRVMVVDALPFYPLIMNPAATLEMVKPQAELIRSQIINTSDEMFEQGQKATASRLAKSKAAQRDIIAWSIASDRNVIAQSMYDNMTTDLRPELSSIRVPVTVLYAWDETMGVPARTVDELYASAYKPLRGVQLHRIDGSYHFIMLDQPVAFAKAAETFVLMRDRGR